MTAMMKWFSRPVVLSHHLPSDSVFAAEVGKGDDASQLGGLVVHGSELNQCWQCTTVAKLLSALFLPVVRWSQKKMWKMKCDYSIILVTLFTMQPHAQIEVHCIDE